MIYRVQQYQMLAVFNKHLSHISFHLVHHKKKINTTTSPGSFPPTAPNTQSFILIALDILFFLFNFQSHINNHLFVSPFNSVIMLMHQSSPKTSRWTDPVPQSLGEAEAHAVEGLKELVGEVLREEGEHEVGALGVGSERSPLQKPFNQHLRVRQPSLS